jgi:hypothetical protein
VLIYYDRSNAKANGDEAGIPTDLCVINRHVGLDLMPLNDGNFGRFWPRIFSLA